MLKTYTITGKLFSTKNIPIPPNLYSKIIIKAFFANKIDYGTYILHEVYLHDSAADRLNYLRPFGNQFIMEVCREYHFQKNGVADVVFVLRGRSEERLELV